MLTMDAQGVPSVDAAAGVTLKPAKPLPLGRLGLGRLAAQAYPKRQTPASRRGQFSLLIVRGDGERVVRLNFPRRTVVVMVAALLAVVSVTGVLFGDWMKLRELTREAVTFNDQIQQQRATINAFNRRVAELRQEMAGWKDLHVKIWEPLGPELVRATRDRGIGGGTTSEGMPKGPSPLDDLNRLGDSVKEQTDSLRALEKLMSRAGKVLAALPTRWPVRGGVNSEFGNRQSPWTGDKEFHSGLDIRAERNTPIYAPAAGIIVHAGPAQDYGTAIVLDHGQDIRSLYGHLQKLNVQVGQRVERGAVIGYTGNTGRSSGPHLHYEILVKGQAVNPRAYLWD
jgi:murein DD-endopeptidase MepM/ murein hydrolase activator NlpD